PTGRILDFVPLQGPRGVRIVGDGGRVLGVVGNNPQLVQTDIELPKGTVVRFATGGEESRFFDLDVAHLGMNEPGRAYVIVPGELPPSLIRVYRGPFALGAIAGVFDGLYEDHSPGMIVLDGTVGGATGVGMALLPGPLQLATVVGSKFRADQLRADRERQ